MSVWRVFWPGGIGMTSLLASACGGDAGSGSTEPPAIAPDSTLNGIEGDPGTSYPSVDAALSGPWLGSFETGLDADEQLWLLPVSGTPVSVMAHNDDPALISSRSTAGYFDETGHISETVFDSIHGRVFVSSRHETRRATRSLDLATGYWSTLPSASLRSTERGAVLLSLEGDTLGVFAAGTVPELETVGSVAIAPDTFVSEVRVQSYRFDGSERLLLAAHDERGRLRELGHFEREGSAWLPRRPSSIGIAVTWISASPSGEHACTIADDDQSAWIANARFSTRIDAPFPLDHCSFSPDGSLVAFTGVPGANQLWIADLNGNWVAQFDFVYLQAYQGDFAYGTTRTDLVRLNWRTLELETLPTPRWCERGDGSFQTVTLVGSTAVVEGSCSSIDSHFSGVYLLPLSDGAEPEPVLTPRAWDILQIAQLADGSALIAQLSHDGELETSAGDRFLRVAGDGSITELGPFPDLPTPLHAPQGAGVR